MLKLASALLAMTLSFSSVSSLAATREEIEEAIQLLRNASSGLQQAFTDSEIKQILRDEGYGSVRIIEKGEIRFKANSNVYVLYIHEDGDLHLYYGATGWKLDYEAMNKWNRTTRLSRAYLDEENDIALETDLLSNAGINRDMVAEMIKVFVQTSVPRFMTFAEENDQDSSQ